MDTNIIINGDSLIELKKISDNSIDLIFADPPYWMRTSGVLKRVEGTVFDGVDDDWDKFESLENYEAFTSVWVSECQRILKPNGAIWVICGMQCIYTVGSIMQKLGFWIINDVIWHKSNPTPNFMGTRLNNSHETLIWASKNSKSKYHFNYKTAKELNSDIDANLFNTGERRQMGSIWKMPVCSGNERLKDENNQKLHNTQKPEDLLYRIINISSKVGDVVLDPFGGTMTTAAVAKKTGRKYIMIEKDKMYCSYGEKRLLGIEEKLTAVELSSYDLKPPKASMEDMINAGYFKLGEKFYLKNTDITAELSIGGKLSYNNEEYDMHTLAALAGGKKSDRVNGFDYWFVLRNEKLISIKKIRDNYRSSLSA